MNELILAAVIVTDSPVNHKLINRVIPPRPSGVPMAPSWIMQISEEPLVHTRAELNRSGGKAGSPASKASVEISEGLVHESLILVIPLVRDSVGILERVHPFGLSNVLFQACS